MDDRTVGLVLRALRRRRGWRQRDLGARAGCSQSLVSLVEAGHLTASSIELLRDLFGALDAQVELTPRWRGADLDRLIDDRHAAIAHRAAVRLERARWAPSLEVTYAEFGERGSIDILAVHPAARAVLVLEVKSEIGSAEATGRKVDEKARLAPTIVRRRHGWTPVVIGRALVLPESASLRRRFESTPVLARMFPDDGLRLRAWLRAPTRNLAAVWFLSVTTPRNLRQGPRRIRVPATDEQGGRAP